MDPTPQALPHKRMPNSGCTLVTIDQHCQRAVLHYGVMKAESEQALAVRCPTCGARPREKCELNNGLPRTEPHPARRPSAEKEELVAIPGLFTLWSPLHPALPIAGPRRHRGSSFVERGASVPRRWYRADP